MTDSTPMTILHQKVLSNLEMKTANLRGLKGLKVRELRQVLLEDPDSFHPSKGGYDKDIEEMKEEDDPNFYWR